MQLVLFLNKARFQTNYVVVCKQTYKNIATEEFIKSNKLHYGWPPKRLSRINLQCKQKSTRSSIIPLVMIQNMMDQEK